MGPILVELRLSRRLACCIVVAYGGAAGTVWSLPVPFFAVLPLTVLIVAAGVLEFRTRVLLRGAAAVTAVHWQADGSWTVRTRGRDRNAWLLAGAYVHPQLTILRLVTDRTLSVVLFSDSLDHDVFRRLRVRLALEASSG